MSSAPYSIISARRRRYFSEQQQQRREDIPMLNEDAHYDYDYEDGGNSSCGEDDNHFLNRNRNRHNRRLFRRLNNINHNHLDSNQIIPRQNIRLRSLFDRINQEIDKYKSNFVHLSFMIHKMLIKYFIFHRTRTKATITASESITY